MSNLSDRSQVNAARDQNAALLTSANTSSRGNGVKGFLLGMLFTILLGLVGGGAYWLAQRQNLARQQGPSNSAGSTAVINPTRADSAADSAADAAADSAANSEAKTLDPGTSAASSDTANGAGIANPPAQSGSAEAFKELNLQVNHPNGSTLRVTGVAVGESTITVKMAITNGYKEAIKLQDDNDATILKDDLGNVYNLAVPPENPTISINPNSTVKGNFVFIGQLAPTATTLTLTTNSKYGGDATYSTDPKFIVGTIPVKSIPVK